MDSFSNRGFGFDRNLSCLTGVPGSGERQMSAWSPQRITPGDLWTTVLCKHQANHHRHRFEIFKPEVGVGGIVVDAQRVKEKRVRLRARPPARSRAASVSLRAAWMEAASAAFFPPRCWQDLSGVTPADVQSHLTLILSPGPRPVAFSPLVWVPDTPPANYSIFTSPEAARSFLHSPTMRWVA